MGAGICTARIEARGVAWRWFVGLALSIVGCRHAAAPPTPAVVGSAPPTAVVATLADAEPPGCLPAASHGPLRARRDGWALYVGASGSGWVLEHAGAQLRDDLDAVLKLRARVDIRRLDEPVYGFGVGMCRADEPPAEERCAAVFSPSPMQCSGAPTRGVCMAAFASPGTDPFVVAERLDRILGGGDDELCYGVVVRDGGPVRAF